MITDTKVKLYAKMYLQLQIEELDRELKLAGEHLELDKVVFFSRRKTEFEIDLDELDKM